MRWIHACLLISLITLSSTAVAQRLADRHATRRVSGIVTDEEGKPAVGYLVRIPALGDAHKAVTTSERGTFTVGVRPGPYLPLMILESPDGARLGFHPGFQNRRLIRITVRPAHTIRCTANDATGKPLAGAHVVAIADYEPIARGVTDEAGRCELSVPPDAEIDWVFGWKAGHAADYMENYTVWPGQLREPPPEKVELNLGAARMCRIRLTDPDGKPVAGVELGPWLIRREGRFSACNLRGSAAGFAVEKTDENGVAEFSWLPKDSSERYQFLLTQGPFHTSDELVSSADGDDELTATVRPTVRVSGTLTTPDGEPAAGVLLQAESTAHMYFRGYAKTDANGRYVFDLYPEQLTAIQVIDPDWASAARQVNPIPGAPPADVDFKLVPGGVLTGRITNADGSPAEEGTHVTVISSNRIVQWFYVDADGEYKARLGPGSYSISMPGSSRREGLTIRNGDELVRNGTIEPERQRDVFSGTVADPVNTAVPGAMIHAMGTNESRAPLNGRTNANGTFRMERQGTTLFICRDLKRNLACRLVVPKEQDSFRFPLQPAVVLTGRLVDPEGMPHAEAVVWIHLLNEDFREIRVSGRADDAGRFTIPALPPGMSASIHGIVGSRYLPAGVVRLGEPGNQDAGELEVQRPR